MAKPFPLNPPHPERNCWGCDRYCAANAMQCGNGSDRTQHPIETFGPGWESWSGIPVVASKKSGPEAPLPVKKLGLAPPPHLEK